MAPPHREPASESAIQDVITVLLSKAVQATHVLDRLEELAAADASGDPEAAANMGCW